MVCLMFVESKAVVYPNLMAGGLRKLALCGVNEDLLATPTIGQDWGQSSGYIEMNKGKLVSINRLPFEY